MASSMGETTETQSFAEYPIGDAWRTRRPEVVSAAVRLLFGPAHSAGVVPHYRKVDIPPDARRVLPRLPGFEPLQGRKPRPGIRRGWRFAACLAVKEADIKEAERIYGSENVAPAVVRMTRGGEVMAGPLGRDFGSYTVKNSEGARELWRTLLYRIGPSSVMETGGPALAVMGDPGRLLIPTEVELLRDRVSLSFDDFWTRRHNTPVV